MCDIPAPPSLGIVRAGTAEGEASTSMPRTRRTAAVPSVATRRQGRVFSIAINAATNAIQTMLISPSAKSDTIRAQQQPTHQAPCLTPISSAPRGPSRQAPRRKPSGLRHLPRHTSLSGVSSYTAATTSVAPATHRPACSHASMSPANPAPAAAIANEVSPAAVHVTRYPEANSSGDNGHRPPLMREYRATVGATDGNIIAAIITIHTPTNQPRVPRPDQGPSSIPSICPAVHHQPMADSATSRTMRPSRARAAAKAGPSPRVPGTRSRAAVVTSSGGPGELGRREPGLALIFDAKGADLGAFRLGHREVRRDRMEHAVELDGLAGLHAERDDFLDLEVNGVADLHRVPKTVVSHLDRRLLDTQHLADERRERRHRAAELPAEHAHQLLDLILRGLLVHEDAELPVPLRHDLRRVRHEGHLQPVDVGAVDVALADVEDECDAAEVIRGAVVEGEVAGAHQLAGARLDVAPLQIPGHGRSSRLLRRFSPLEYAGSTDSRRVIRARPSP